MLNELNHLHRVIFIQYSASANLVAALRDERMIRFSMCSVFISDLVARLRKEIFTEMFGCLLGRIEAGIAAVNKDREHTNSMWISLYCVAVVIIKLVVWLPFCLKLRTGVYPIQ